MKALQQMPGAWDRMATREELCQVFDLLESIPAARGVERTLPTELPLTLAGSDGIPATRDLWLDRAEEEPVQDQVDSNLETLAELFADRNSFVN